MLNGLDLFTGIGGITVALEPWVRPIAYCENDRYAQCVLASRMAGGDIPCAPIWSDVKTLTRRELPAVDIDIITGGFPCQDISVAGTGAGLGGERSGLFFEIIRLTRDLRPRFVFLENVPAITVRGLDCVLLEITTLGYDARWTIVSAAEVGALHLRERWFLLAHSNDKGSWASNGIPSDTDSKAIRPQSIQGAIRESSGWSAQSVQERAFTGASEGLAKPSVDRTGDGIPYRVDRDRGLGNSVCPQAARKAFKILSGIGGG